MECKVCGHPNSPDTIECPVCRTSLSDVSAWRRPAWLTWNWSLRRLAIAILLVLLPTIPHLIELLQLTLPLRSSVLVREAVTRASEDPRVIAQLGQPIDARWSVRGYIRRNESGWSEGRIWIPIEGPRGEATVYARAGRGTGLWVFTTLEFQPPLGESVDLLARNDPSADLVPRGRVYLVPLGRPNRIALEPFREYYRATFNLDVTVLPPVSVDPASFDEQRRQLVAESVISSMRRSLPELEADPAATVIGVTEQDMYIARLRWSFAFNFRSDDRFSVVSTARMVPWLHSLWPRDDLLASRLRKMLTKNVGVLAYGLPLNDDPTSLLYRGIGSVDDLDLVQERFEGLGRQAVVGPTVVTHHTNPLEPEIRRDASSREPAHAEYPCFRVSPLTTWNGVVPIAAAVGDCVPGMLTDRMFDELEIDLRSGLLVTRTTDLFRSDSIPLVLTRCYHAWDTISRAFGLGGNHPYDILPVGSRSPYTYIDLVMADGAMVHYDRISEGTGYSDAVYQHFAKTAFLGSTFRWNGNGWDLRFADGGLFVFPENYAGVRAHQGAPTGMRDAAGHSLDFQRDRDRSLRRLTSPAGSFIAFKYDDGYRITEAADDRGEVVRYAYDVGGRLSMVSRGERRIQYAYDGTRLVRILTGGGRILLSVAYDRGRVAQLNLADGRVYRFRFSFAAGQDEMPTHVDIENPNGTTTSLDVTSPTNATELH